MAKQIVVGDEDPSEFEVLRVSLQQEFAPGTSFAKLMVDHLAELWWRLRRVARLEAAIFEAHLTVSGAETKVSFDETRHYDHLAEATKRYLPENRLPREENPPQAALIDSREQKNEAISDQARAGAIHSPEPKVEREPVIKKLGMAIVRDGQITETLAKLTRHETFLMNCLSKTLNLLHLYQSREQVLGMELFFRPSVEAL